MTSSLKPEAEAVRQALLPVIEEARRAGLWLNSGYQDLWFSPDELESLNLAGQFLWGPANWTLRDPKGHVAQMRKQITAAERELASFAGRAGLLV
jgi:hypothetical protein